LLCQVWSQMLIELLNAFELKMHNKGDKSRS